MTIDKQKLLQWIESKRYVFGGPYDDDESQYDIQKYEGALMALSLVERAVELGEFKQEEEVVNLCNLKLLANS